MVAELDKSSPDIDRGTPGLVIAGMPKAATTSLFEALATHSMIAPSRLKEPNYWCFDLRWDMEHSPRLRVAYRRGRLPSLSTDYEALFPHDGRIRMEASVNYIYSRVAPLAIKTHNPAAKAIVVLREPTEFIRSYHRFLVSGGVEDLDIRDAYYSSPHRELPRFHVGRHAYDYRRVASVAQDVERWQQTFGEDLLVLTYDEITMSWANTRHRILRFLDIPYEEIALPKTNPSRAVRNRFIMGALLSVPPRVRDLLGPLRVLGGKLYKKAMYVPAPKARWSPPKSDFVDEVNDLNRLVDTDLKATWGYR